VELAALDLVGGEHGDEVVDVRAAGDVHGQGFIPVEKATATTARRADCLPRVQIGVAMSGEG